jgi:hypothetical protein
MKPVGVVSSNIGGHVRHCLDHIDALVCGIDSGVIDYDSRQRGTNVESSRQAALAVLNRQERQMLASPVSLERPLGLSVLLGPSGPPLVVATSLGRELAFVLGHTIHHNALIAIMAKTLGVPLPKHFGYAPSTIAYLEKARCVR